MSQHVALRAPKRGDAEHLADVLNDQETASWRTYAYPATLADAEAMLLSADARTDVHVIQASDGLGPDRFAGVICTRTNGAAAADVEFVVHPGCRRRGVASGALRLLADRMLAVGTDSSSHLARPGWRPCLLASCVAQRLQLRRDPAGSYRPAWRTTGCVGRDAGPGRPTRAPDDVDGPDPDGGR